ncbi:MAG TPA: glycosyltransferase [Ramlibacter sp.]|nr:glycosyltransferase [Ramlibacter sp.]
MLEIGLSMMVKNEESNIVPCLEPIVDLFRQVVIIDTGSTDRTRQILQERFGIETLSAELDPAECYALATPRNRSFGLLDTKWILTLDADERIDRNELLAVLALDDEALPSGLFCAWNTDLGKDGVVEDYKLCLFRHGYSHLGLVHDTVQPSLRESGASAKWCPQMQLRHQPDLRRTREKQDWYSRRLACARARQPGWLRYHWFTAYMHFQAGDFGEAAQLLQQVHDGRPPLFPVESLNASMLLASLTARSGDRRQTNAVLDDALGFYQQVRDDFEVRVNFRLGPWLAEAAGFAANGKLDAIVPYRFAY